MTSAIIERSRTAPASPAWGIEGAEALLGDRLAQVRLQVDPHGGAISAIDRAWQPDGVIDARGLLALPGIVDLHGDAFERQLHPRPNVDFPIDLALFDSDRQVVASGITTIFHGVTWSWEPGLRGAETARSLVETIAAMRSQLAADTRCHLRHEAFNIDGEAEIAALLRVGRIDMLAFNDHMTSIAQVANRAGKLDKMVERSGISPAEFSALVERTLARAGEVDGSVSRLAAVARAAHVPLVSHDDSSIAQRRWYRERGCRVAEFPINRLTAEEAATGGDYIVFGAPNVVRGGSHTGWTRAADMVADGLCDVLASDYYYPAPLVAAFRLAADGILPLARAWALVSKNAACAAGLTDRGEIAEGARADMVLVDTSFRHPRVVATLVAGRLVQITEPQRLSRPVPATQASMAAAE